MPQSESTVFSVVVLTHWGIGFEKQDGGFGTSTGVSDRNWGTLAAATGLLRCCFGYYLIRIRIPFFKLMVAR